MLASRPALPRSVRLPLRYPYFRLLRVSLVSMAALDQGVCDDGGSEPPRRPPVRRRLPWKTAAWDRGRPARDQEYQEQRGRGRPGVVVSSPRYVTELVLRMGIMASRRRHEEKGRHHSAEAGGPCAEQLGVPRDAPDPLGSGDDGDGRDDVATWCDGSVKRTARVGRRVLYVAALD